MNIKDAYHQLIREYLAKCGAYGCDSCVAEYFCIENMYKKSRQPEEDCPEKLMEYFKRRKA